MGLPHHQTATGKQVQSSERQQINQSIKSDDVMVYIVCITSVPITQPMSSSFFFLSQSDIGTQQERDARTAKALTMSLKYSFVTPVTSMVVTKPETEEGSASPLIADKLTEGRETQVKSLAAAFFFLFVIKDIKHDGGLLSNQWSS